MGLKYTKRAMTSYEVHRFFHGLEVSFSPDTFTMSKFNKEQKIEIYRKWKDEKISISQLSKTYKTNVANLDYMLRLIDMYGINVLDRPYQVYSKEFKEQAIEQAVFSTKAYV